jgi:thioredoxin reductase (NADPH)
MDVFVIGAGFAAAEEAIFLTRFAKKVTIIVRKAEFACSKTISDQVFHNKKIEVRFNTELLALTGDDVPKKARFVNNATKEEWEYETADPNGTFGVFVFVGYEPVSDLFKGQLTMDEQGYIVTDEDMKTNLEGVYAAGDIRPKRLRQLVTAVSDGAISATSIEKFAETKKEHLGITIEPPAMKEAGEHSTQQAAKQETGQAAEQGAEQGAGFAADASAVESFIDDDIKEQLAPVFEKFEHPVKLALISAENNALTNEMLQFAKDFSALSKNLSFVQYTRQESKYAVDLYPALAILKDDGSFAGITYHGVPGGHEFNSFVLALYNTAGPGQQVEPHVMDKIKSINRPINIKVCVSLSCTMCPELVTATQYIAAHNPNISAAMLDISHFPDIKSRYNIMSVPAMIINDEKIVFGKKDISQVLDLLTEK